MAGRSYTEVLYYLDSLGSAGIKLTTLVVQVNYQSFWNGGIRDSLLDLLSEPAFRGRVESRAHSSESYAPIFQDALKQYQERQERAPKAGEATARGGFGAGIEDTARGWLEHLPLYQSRPAEKQAFDQMLYRGRLYFLHIKPSTARSITGPRLERNQAALDAVAATCRETSVTLALFTAPVNPLVSLYATPENKSNFSGFVRGLSKKYDLPLFDFEGTVSADLWGRQYNGPDPLHMGRKAHQLVAEEMIAAIQAALPARREVR